MKRISTCLIAALLSSSAMAQVTQPGTAAGTAMTVQGNASGIPVPVSGTTSGSSQYPSGAVPETISATATTASFTATLAAAAAKTTYICGVEIDAVATAGTAVTWTLTGTITGTMNFIEMVGTLTNSANGRNVYNFNPCIPASAANTTIVVNAGAAGSGGVASASAWGYQL